MYSTSVTRSVLMTLLFVLAGQLGCEPAAPPAADGRAPRKSPALPAPAPEPAPAAEDELPPAVAVAAGEKPWIDTAQLPWEAWYLQYLDNKRIGYSHVSVNRSALESANKTIRIHRVDCIEVLGSGTKSIFKRTIVSTEYADGRLISMSDTSQSLNNIASTEGTLAQNTYTATTTVGEEATTQSVPWEAGAWGVMGLQAILMQHPPQPGELLEAKVFVPQLYKIAKAELLAGQPDLVRLPGGKIESLLPVDVILWTEESGMRSRNWINARGEVLKTISTAGPKLSTFWTPAEEAYRVRDEFEFDELLTKGVDVSGGENLAQAEKVVYGVARNAESTGVEVYTLLAKAPQQAVTSVNALSAEVTVSKIKPEQLHSATDQAASDAPADNYLAASKLVPADQQPIKQLAQELNVGQSDIGDAAADNLEAVGTALQITRRLHEKLTTTPLNREVASPQQTILALSGDCVDQAILLTALLRSQQIAARVASGLAVDPDNSTQLRFAMWTEAWLAGGWIPLDATTGQIAAADRLKILDSSLDGDNPYQAILPVCRELTGLEIKVISQK